MVPLAWSEMFIFTVVTTSTPLWTRFQIMRGIIYNKTIFEINSVVLRFFFVAWHFTRRNKQLIDVWNLSCKILQSKKSAKWSLSFWIWFYFLWNMLHCTKVTPCGSYLSATCHICIHRTSTWSKYVCRCPCTYWWQEIIRNGIVYKEYFHHRFFSH